MVTVLDAQMADECAVCGREPAAVVANPDWTFHDDERIERCRDEINGVTYFHLTVEAALDGHDQGVGA